MIIQITQLVQNKSVWLSFKTNNDADLNAIK